MKACGIILTTLVLAGIGRADITASLKLAKIQDKAAFPYRKAELTLTNAGPGTVDSVLLRPLGGGPAVRYAFTVPPGRESRLAVALPAMAVVQDYQVTALSATRAAVGRARAGITWPGEAVTADAFIDDSFKPWADEPARWPAGTRRSAVLLLALCAVAMAAALFVRRHVLRAAVVAALAAVAATELALLFMPAGPPAVEDWRYQLIIFDGRWPDAPRPWESESFAVLSARRTTAFQQRASPTPHPVYPDRAAAAGEDAVVDPAALAIRLTLRPGRVRIIRPAWWDRPTPMTVPRRGAVRRTGDGLTVEADRILPGSLLIREDSVWPVGAVGLRQVTVADNEAQSLRAFVASGRAALHPESRRLLEYWRGKHQRPGAVYLVGASYDHLARIASMQVLALAQAATSAPATRPAGTTR